MHLVQHEGKRLAIETHAARRRAEQHVVQVERSPGGEDGMTFSQDGLHVAQPPVPVVVAGKKIGRDSVQFETDEMLLI